MEYTLQELVERGFVTKVQNKNRHLKITFKTNFPTIEKIDIVIGNNIATKYAVSAVNKILVALDNLDIKVEEENKEDEEGLFNDLEEDEDYEADLYDDDEENEDYDDDEDMIESLRITRGH